MDTKTAGRRKKLEPDPRVRLEILSAASKIVREDGVRALSIAEPAARFGRARFRCRRVDGGQGGERQEESESA